MISPWFVSICYLLFAYGISVIFTQAVGPFNVFIRLRVWAESISDNFGLLFKCMTCFPTNVGWVFSLVNWFLIPVPISPFNIILQGTGLWWLAVIMDACITGGVCHFLWNLDDFIDKSTPVFMDETEGEDDIIRFREN